MFSLQYINKLNQPTKFNYHGLGQSQHTKTKAHAI